jgi:hypothetical protein
MAQRFRSVAYCQRQITGVAQHGAGLREAGRGKTLFFSF